MITHEPYFNDDSRCLPENVMQRSDMQPPLDYQLGPLDVMDVEGPDATNVADSPLSPDTFLRNPVEINGIRFKSVKHIYWAFLIQGDREDRVTLSHLNGPRLAKTMWNHAKVEDWARHRFAAMGIAVHLAIRNNPEMQEALERLSVTHYTPKWGDSFFARDGNYMKILRQLRAKELHASRELTDSEKRALKDRGMDVEAWAGQEPHRPWLACVWNDSNGDEQVMFAYPSAANIWVKQAEGRSLDPSRKIADIEEPFVLTIQSKGSFSQWVGEKRVLHSLAMAWKRNKGGQWEFTDSTIFVRAGEGEHEKRLTIRKFYQ